MIILIHNSISLLENDEDDFEYVTRYVTHTPFDDVDDLKQDIIRDFEKNYGSEEFELDWSRWEDHESVRVKVKEGFGDNDSTSCGYKLIGE